MKLNFDWSLTSDKAERKISEAVGRSYNFEDDSVSPDYNPSGLVVTRDLGDKEMAEALKQVSEGLKNAAEELEPETCPNCGEVVE